LIAERGERHCRKTEHNIGEADFTRESGVDSNESSKEAGGD
jgi:hypothetical protein